MFILLFVVAALGVRAYSRDRRNAQARANVVVANAVLTAFTVWVAWFALLFTGKVRLLWLTRWLGVDRLDQSWIRVVVFTPSLAAAAFYLLFEALHRE
jgi:hypothetical protein